ncbi:DUF6392 family protein [Aeromonas hydrophila]|uniref:DUF6392 family protein n=1 Tax=Aeromonas hydrophila TaxID=644 RepID=UPI0023788C74|nr:DUF6392 family protein [Aeromonas hydrophila]MDD9224998.1 DUF6392 family protein [Aeromonas hydrophila]
MTVNVKAIINSLGLTYEELLEANLIPYKTKPKGDSGSPYVDLDMAKEGVILTFERLSKKLIEIDLSIVDDDRKNYVFPNELPSPLWADMHRPIVHEKFGTPINSYPPYEVMKMQFGGIDHYILSKGNREVSMLLHYNMDQVVAGVTFKPTALVQWKELDPSLLLN